MVHAAILKLSLMILASLLPICFCGVIKPNSEDSEKQLLRAGKTLNSNSTSDFINDLSRILQGSAGLIQSLIEAKKEAVEPILEVKKSLLESDVIESALDAKSAIVSNIVAAGPQITSAIVGVAEIAAEAAPSIIKAGLCNVVCPITGQEQCKKDHCQNEGAPSNITPREAVESNPEMKSVT